MRLNPDDAIDHLDLSSKPTQKKKKVTFWQSKRLYRHPEYPEERIFGRVVLYKDGTFGFCRGIAHIKCDTDWAEEIYCQEEG